MTADTVTPALARRSRGPAPPATRPRAASGQDGALAVRLVAFLALGGWGAVHWGAMVLPAAGARMLVVVGLAGAVALLGRRLARLDGRRRLAPLGMLGLGALLTAGAVVGAPRWLLVPAGWPDLAGGLVEGLTALPDVRIPYAGSDSWARLAILAGGALLLLGSAPGALRARGRGRSVAAVALAVLYAVPAVELTPSAQFVRGLAFALLLSGFLWLDRVQRADARAAGAMLVAAVAVGAALAPRLDGSRPWIPYETIAESLGSRAGVGYEWDHRYGPLDWPRDGRELFRVRTPRRLYWKTTTLDTFDGLRWMRARERFGATLADELPAGYRRRRDWNPRVRVTVRSLRSSFLVAAGTTLAIGRVPSAAVAQAAPGNFSLEEPLGRGDSYEASIYSPAPTARQLAGAGTAYPQLASRYLELVVPAGRRRARATGAPTVAFGRWGSGQAPVVVQGPPASAERRLRSSAYAGAWALSRRLASRSASPYDYAQRVLSHLAGGYSYTEDPLPRAVPLEAFLVRDRAGYCQQFAGAMAMLLRMGGVPARAVAGFSPGAYSPRLREWVVRDLDAHSWVEAYFPGYGWVTFDPTPPAAPARSQITYRLAGVERLESPAGALGSGDRPEARRRAPRGGGGGAEGQAAGRRGTILFGAVAVALALVAAAWALRRRQPRSEGDPQLAELVRALRRAGRPRAPGTTLQQLQDRLGGGDADAAGYLRALASARYGHGGTAPTPAQRRGLRRALARGGGRLGGLRALWALPPRLGVRGEAGERARRGAGAPGSRF